MPENSKKTTRSNRSLYEDENSSRRKHGPVAKQGGHLHKIIDCANGFPS